jgi:methyl-accepting chemotaxis protein
VLGKRIVGVVFLLIGILGLVISIAGFVLIRQAIDEIGAGLESTMDLTLNSLETVSETLVLTKDTVGQVGTSLDTVGQVASNVSETISVTKPALDQVTVVATEDVPSSLEQVQQALPDVAEAAGAIDSTLRLLDSFELQREIFGIPISFDLGIDYNPEESLDEAVLVLGQSLDGVPQSLRGLQVNLEAAGENLEVIGQNLDVISEDLDQMNMLVADFGPLIDDYLRLVSDTEELIRDTKGKLADQVATAKTLASAVFVWLAVFQIVPLYLAYGLLTARKDQVDKIYYPDEEE